MIGMIGYLKKKLIWLLTGFAVMVFGFTLITLNMLKDNGNLYIKTIQGDKSVLKDVEIRGTLHDSYTGIEFSLRDGKVSQRFNYFNSFMDSRPYMVIANKDVLWSGNNEYYTSIWSGRNGQSEIAVRVARNTLGKRKSPYKIINTGLTSSNHVPSLGSVENITILIEEIDEKLYLIIPTDESFRGKSGIYEISYWPTGSEDTGYRKLVDIDLEDGKVEVKGMLRVDNKLCIVMIKDNKPLIQYFDLASKELSQPLEIEHEIFHQGVIHLYIAGVHSYDNYFILSVDKGEQSQRAYIIDVSNEPFLVNSIDVKVPRRGEMVDMIYKNNMLYVAAIGFDFVDIREPITTTIGPVFNIDLAAYDNNGDLKFLGTIESDINDDVLWQRNRYKTSGDSYYESRHYGKIKLR
jgi:hypothetical protein